MKDSITFNPEEQSLIQAKEQIYSELLGKERYSTCGFPAFSGLTPFLKLISIDQIKPDHGVIVLYGLEQYPHLEDALKQYHKLFNVKRPWSFWPLFGGEKRSPTYSLQEIVALTIQKGVFKDPIDALTNTDCFMLQKIEWRDGWDYNAYSWKLESKSSNRFYLHFEHYTTGF